MTQTSREAIGDDLPELGERGRWSGSVIGTERGTFTWGTHEFYVELQHFDDGVSNIQLWGPTESPACARDIVADLLAGTKLGRAIGAKLAAEWGVAVDELEVER